MGEGLHLTKFERKITLEDAKKFRATSRAASPFRLAKVRDALGIRSSRTHRGNRVIPLNDIF